MAARFLWTTEIVREALGVPASGAGSREYAGISTDTRTLRTGELYVALRGERFDGTDFVAEAIAAGASGAVVERPPTESVPRTFELFVVDDSLAALGQLATARRRGLEPTVVAITGTSGKTTTRELMAAALGGLPGRSTNSRARSSRMRRSSWVSS